MDSTHRNAVQGHHKWSRENGYEPVEYVHQENPGEAASMPEAVCEASADKSEPKVVIPTIADLEAMIGAGQAVGLSPAGEVILGELERAEEPTEADLGAIKAEEPSGDDPLVEIPEPAAAVEGEQKANIEAETAEPIFGDPLPEA